LSFFSEGTTTNGRSLLNFKSGAFSPGLPVQPVVLRFDNEPDTTRWTWKQNLSSMTMFFLTLCQLWTNAEVKDNTMQI
jgi:lysophosphatidylcholine acyltransferase/lyso-PAF acetyltransferase